MFQEKWKQVLARALNSETEKTRHRAQLEIEAAKADVQRSIETYKVSLVTEVEQLKARVERTKSLAIRYSITEYEALMELHSAINRVDTSVLSFATFRPDPPLSHDKRVAELEKATVLIDCFNAARAKANIFLSIEMRRKMANFKMLLTSAAYDHGHKVAAPLPNEAVANVMMESTGLGSALEERIRIITNIG